MEQSQGTSFGSKFQIKYTSILFDSFALAIWD